MHRSELISTSRVIPETGSKFLHGHVQRAFQSQRTKESGWEATRQHSSEERRVAKRNPHRGDRGIPRDTSGNPWTLVFEREGFPDEWKGQRLIFLRKSEKPLKDASSYIPICLLDTIEKFMGKMEELHPGDDAGDACRLPVTDDR